MRSVLITFLILSISISTFAANPNVLVRDGIGQPQRSLSEYRKEYGPIYAPEKPAAQFTSKDLESVIPMNMEPTQSAGSVATKIGDRLVQKWLESDAVKSSAVGRTASTVENAMKTEVQINKNESTGVNHKFSFQVLALQALTKLEYSGWWNATLNYDARERQTGLEVREKVFHNKDFFINHKVSSVEDMSSMGLRWSW